ncbi:P450 monooxygenase [Apiospora sp. TS-2023a]
MSDVILFLFSSFCAVLIWSWFDKQPQPKSGSKSHSKADKFPCADSSWPIVRQWKSLTSSKSILHNVYQKQLVDHQPYTLNGMFGDAVVLPPSMMPWLLAQPEQHLSAKWAQLDALNIPLTFLNPDIGIHPIHEPIIRRTLTAHLDGITGMLHEEVALALDELWGGGKDTGDTKETWREVNLDYTIRRVVARASNRVFVGLPLCRDDDYIENCISYTTWVSTSGLLISTLPRWLKSSLGLAFTTPIRMVYSRCAKHLLPYFRDLVSGNNAAEMRPSSRQHLFSTWLVDNSQKLSDDSPERTLEYLSRRIMALNFAAIHTSTLTTSNLLLDLFSTTTSPSQAAPAPPYTAEALSATSTAIRLLRDEALTNAAARQRAAREHAPLGPRAQGSDPQDHARVPGVTLPDGHGYLPPGTMVCVSGWGLHHDEALYTRPYEFVWDRFVGGDANNSSSSTLASEGQEEAEEAKATAAAAAETDRQFAAWGIGKHACPGRFFAVDLIKIIVGKILTDYEVKLGKERPENVWIEYTMIPPPSATLSVRRRKALV